MSDYASSLPVRTENNGDIASKISDGTTPAQFLAVDAQGRASVKTLGDYDAVTNVTPASVGTVAHDRGATIDETSQNKRVTAVAGAANSICMDISLHDEDGAVYSDANPLPVLISEVSGVEIHNYDTQAALAAAASDNHDYTTGAEFELKKVWCSASGKAKFEVQKETAAASATFVTIAVGFNSTANPNVEFTFAPNVIVVSGAIVRVIRTNKDNQAQDVYSTIMGAE